MMNLGSAKHLVREDVPALGVDSPSPLVARGAVDMVGEEVQMAWFRAFQEAVLRRGNLVTGS